MSRATAVEALWTGLRDNSGEPLAGGKVFFYEPGTTTLKDVYTEQDKSVISANPVILDGNGRKQIFADGGYKIVVKDASDVTIQTLDDHLYGVDDNEAINGGTTTGAVNEYSITPSPALTSYVDGQEINLIAHLTNTITTPTGNVSTLGALTMVDPYGDALKIGDIQAGGLYKLRVAAGSPNKLRVLNPSVHTIPNNLNLVSRNVADNGNVSILKVNASDELEVQRSIIWVGDNLQDIGKASKRTKDIHMAGNIVKNMESWTPAISATGSMTITGLSIHEAVYQVMGGYLHFNVGFSGTLVAPVSNYVRATVPVAGVAHNVNQSFVVAGNDGGGAGMTDLLWRYDGTHLLFFRFGLANFAAGANAAFFLSDKYRLF